MHIWNDTLLYWYGVLSLSIYACAYIKSKMKTEAYRKYKLSIYACAYIETWKPTTLISGLHYQYMLAHILKLLTHLWVILTVLLSIYACAYIETAKMRKFWFNFYAQTHNAHKDYFMWDLLFVRLNKEPYRERYIRYAI